MARQFGIVTTSIGSTSVVINSLEQANSVEVAEARDGKGKVTDMQAYSLGKTITMSGVIDALPSALVTAGSKLTVGGKDYILESVTINEVNTEFATATITARTADAANIIAYVAPTSGNTTT